MLVTTDSCMLCCSKLCVALVSRIVICSHINKRCQDQENLFYEITNRCSYMQSILFHCYVHSACFGCFTHPSSGVQFLTVSTATGTNHSIVSATYSQRGLQATLGIRLTTLSPTCSVFMKYGNLNFLEPSGPLQACNGTAS